MEGAESELGELLDPSYEAREAGEKEDEEQLAEVNKVSKTELRPYEGPGLVRMPDLEDNSGGEGRDTGLHVQENVSDGVHLDGGLVVLLLLSCLAPPARNSVGAHILTDNAYDEKRCKDDKIVLMLSPISKFIPMLGI